MIWGGLIATAIFIELNPKARKKVRQFTGLSDKTSKEINNLYDKSVKALKNINDGVTILMSEKFKMVDVLVGLDAPEKIIDNVQKALTKAKIDLNKVDVVGDSSLYDRKQYDRIEKLNGGHKHYN